MKKKKKNSCQDVISKNGLALITEKSKTRWSVINRSGDQTLSFGLITYSHLFALKLTQDSKRLVNKWLGKHSLVKWLFSRHLKEESEFHGYLEKRISVCLGCFKPSRGSVHFSRETGEYLNVKVEVVRGQIIFFWVWWKTIERYCKGKWHFLNIFFKESLWILCGELDVRG